MIARVVMAILCGLVQFGGRSCSERVGLPVEMIEMILMLMG